MAEDKKAEKETKKPAKAEKDSKKATNKKKTKKNPFKSMAAFFKGVNAERKKVIWPGAAATIKNAAIVLLVTAVVGVCIYGVDTLLSLGMKGVKNLAEKTSVSDTVEDNDNANALEDILSGLTSADADNDSADDTAE